ncbi:MAG: hypothetical protein P8Y02_01955 [Deinococcales bacterium]
MRPPPALRAVPGQGAPRVIAVACALLALLGPAVAAAQGDGATVELGLGGNLVADAWNPVRVTVRDAAPSVLRVRIDEGSLLEGPRIVRYSANLPGGSGVTVFDDDLFVPTFRTLSYTLVSGRTVLASGSLGAGDADARPLDVILSGAPGRWRGAFGSDARIVDVAASDLPARAAAFDGVRTLLVDGSAAAPRAESVAAAASGGVQVVLAGPLPASQAQLGRLAGRGSARLGVGEVVRVAANPRAVRAAMAGWQPIDRQGMVQALAAERLVQPPRAPGQPLMLSLAAAYVLVTLLGLRFGGTPGLVAGLVLAAVIAAAGWRLLRPPSAELSASSTVLIGGGELALALQVDERLTLPSGEVTLPRAGRPLSPLPYAVEDGSTRVELPRWHAVAVAAHPELRTSALRFEGGRLVNTGREPLHGVYVLGLGRQPDLPAGASVTPGPGEEGGMAPPLARLAALLPAGTALASAPAAVWVALPPLSQEGSP